MIRTCRATVSVLVVAALAACGGTGDSPGEAEGASPNGGTETLRYNRDYVFVARTAEGPLVVPFRFRASDGGEDLERTVTGWLARGGTWDRFLEEQSRTSRSAGVWRVLPDGDLTVLAGGATEVEGLRFDRGDRRLNLDLGSPLTGWNQGGETRFRILEGQLNVGGEAYSGPVLELLRVDRVRADGWPAPQEFDALFLTSGDSLQMMIAEGLGTGSKREGFSWYLDGEIERNWDQGEVRWVEVLPYQEARRDIPRRWTFRIPGAAVTGEVSAAGFDVEMGPEREARRALEVRYTVEGWVEIDGQRSDVTGMIRHTQQ